MAWTNAIYEGLRMTGQPSNYRVALFELARALNERESAVRATTTKFIKADETQGDHVIFSEFQNLHMPHYCTNMNRLRAGIGNLISDADAIEFTTAGGTPYTVASVEAAIGGSLSTNMIKPNDTEFLQAMQNALDLLLFVTVTDPTFLSGGGAYERFHGTGITRDLAWAAMTGQGSGSDLANARTVHYTSGQTFGTFYAVRSQQTKSQTIDCTAYDNGIDVTGGRYYVDAKNTCNKDIALTITSTEGHSTGTSPQGTDQVVTIEMAQPDCNTTTAAGVAYGFDVLESSVPFTGNGVSEFQISSTVEIDMDISPILTDQA